MRFVRVRRRWSASVALLCFGQLLVGCPFPLFILPPTENIAQEWNALLRTAALEAGQPPTVEARNFFHVSAAMYEAWAAYDARAAGYFTGKSLKRPVLERNFYNRAEALSHAVYGVLTHRYQSLQTYPVGSPQRRAFDAFLRKMQTHGYIDVSGNVVPSEAQALGTQIASIIIAYGNGDGANELNGYADTFGYTAVNPPIIAAEPGTNGMQFPDEWQPIVTPDGALQAYATPHWGAVAPFSLAAYNAGALRFEPGPLPRYGTESHDAFVAEFVSVLRFSQAMDPGVGEGAEMVNLSPRVRGLETPGDYFYEGHAVNPYTDLPYVDHIVPMGDYLRVLAVYHDGKRHATPVPWWNEVASDVLQGSGIVTQRVSQKLLPADIGYDVKLYFALNAALHDAAIAIWDIKYRYNTARPISAIRYLAETGGLPLEPGFIEVIQPGDPLAGLEGEFVGDIKVQAWAGPENGVQWIRAMEWLPYQAENFVSPPFPGYDSGHTAFSRAAAEVLTAYTGDPYFPGGLAQVRVDHLRFETNLSQPVTLQWATYRDMADETALARVVCGVHIPLDTSTAKPIGEAIASQAHSMARAYFQGDGQGIVTVAP